MSVSDWSAVADENTTVDGINIAEHCPAKNINNAIRSVMAALKTKCDTLDSTDNSLRRGAVIGEIRWFAMFTPPEGWLVCNGASVLISDYPALYNTIGTLFWPKGVSASPATFNLPNLMSKVPWGSTSVGTVIDAGLPDITGTLYPIATNRGSTNDFTKTGVFINTTHADMDGGSGSTSQRVTVQFKASRSNPIYGRSDTVQPPALCLLPCIRYE